MGTYYFSDNPNGFRTGQRFSVDKPALTFMAAGMGGDSLGHWHFAEDNRKDHPVIDDVPKVPKPSRPPQLFDARDAKPPYRVPLVSEIRKIKPNGFKVATTFAGAGGSSTGYRLAGFQIVWANEFVPIAQESYRANAMPYTIVDGRDIKQVQASEILAATKLRVGELDVFDGSPPCQAFSTAGKREKGWGTERHYEHGASQKNEELFFDYIRLRDGLMPKVFVAENVSGLVKGTAKGFFLEILKELKRGYRVRAPLLDAQWLGVPQARQRIVFIGVRDDLEIDPPQVRPLPYRYSVRDALPWLAGGVMSSGHQLAERDLDLDEPGKTVLANETGGSYRNARVVHDARGSFKSGGHITDRPAPTILSSQFTPHHFQVYGPEPSPTIVGPRASGHFKVTSRGGRGRSLDEPAPTVMTHNRPGTRSEMAEQNSNATHARKGERRSLDEPAPTLMARRSNVDLVRGDARLVSNNKFEEKLIGIDGPSPTIMASGPGKTSGQVIVPTGDEAAITGGLSIEGQAIGAEYDRLNPGQQSDKYFSLVRADPALPSPTLTAAGGQNAGIATVVHPTEKRKFTILEVKRLCSFPDDFELKGTYGQQWERLGNSVPPVMMQHIAEAIRDGVLVPARARTPGPAPRSGDRSTKGKRRKGEGRPPPDAPPAAARRAGKRPAGRTRQTPPSPKEPAGGAP